LTASEVAFLALGLVLGVACGAALIEVLRSKPPASREVRVTVAPNAIHARFPATLADPTASPVAPGPAAGGPGDRRWHDETGDEDPAATGRRAVDRLAKALGEPVMEATSKVSSAGTSVPSAEGLSRPDPLWLTTRRDERPALVPVPISLEPDPLTEALRSRAAAVASAGIVDRGAVATERGSRGDSVTPLDRGDAAPSSPRSSTPVAGAGRTAAGAVSGRTSAPDEPASPAAPGSAPTGTTETSKALAAPPAPSATAAAAQASNAAAVPPAPSATATTTQASKAAVVPPAPGATATGPCADERRVAEERCAVASRARDGATAAAEALRTAQRAYDDQVSAAETASATADPRYVRAAKETAQQRFRDARSGAFTRDDVERAARDWLAEINRINIETREATARAEKSRTAATQLAAGLERLAVEADAARISAERAEEACIAAREAVAACDESQAIAAAAAKAAPPTTQDRGRRPPSAGRAPAAPVGEAQPAFEADMGSRAGQDALILRVLRGDREAMQRAVARLAAGDPDGARRWQPLLAGLAEALVARSIEAAAFDFPVDHFFWGPFSQAQNRDIVSGLSSLGFRFDGFGGWLDDRVPSQRDLSLAVGYAGLDPMRIRHWPNEPEMQALLTEVRVAADEYVASAAGGLTLGELVTLLGRRADALTELWNAWGTVRPVLLESD